ncbi:hypothetical protein BT96DRAFT_926316 [Gymnopus androsaceus JB14]|uniref:Nephrocystin 3-like N-terminal domain-containing protein n=1 Tax=Gymnopus androsaceus JB14 TaxID=1447944 RepID=A0A6A4GWN7_9AGAR|nr:hypothetical protein BT96DRAFT_926316 [Gymnopus androsaceus JB14]
MFSNAQGFGISGGEFNNIQGNQYNISYQDPKILHEIIMRKLTYSQQAFYDAGVGIRLARKPCSSGTREQILSDIEKWATSKNPFNALGYWMCGMAGTGKSTIAMSLCMRLKKKGLLAGTFFCSHQIPECRDYQMIVPTLVYQLAKFSGIFAASLMNIMQEDPDHLGMPEEQIKKLLVEPWNAIQ